MKEAIKQKRIGIGSLALALSIIAIIWSCNIGWFDNLCLGDVVLNYIGIPCWSKRPHKIPCKRQTVTE